MAGIILKSFLKSALRAQQRSFNMDGARNGRNGRGALIVFEGLDRCGKSTQVQLLVDELQKKYKAVKKKFPTRADHVGELIDKYLRKEVNLTDEAIHLLFSADRWESQKSLLTEINNGVTIVLDRYVYSGAAFSAAKGLDLKWCINSDAGLPAPDCVIYLDVSEKTLLNRTGFGDERYESVGMQNKASIQFKRLMQIDANAGNPWKVIDSNGQINDIHQQVVSHVMPLLKSMDATTPIRKLPFLTNNSI